MPKRSFSIGRSIKYASISLYALAGVCFMIYTTQQSYTYAEGDEDLGYDLKSVDASVTVGTACTFTGTVTAPHTATIANGINSTDIGTTVLNTKCNDSGGYALYAIGYTGDEYGATDLTYTSLDGTTTNSDYNIATGTNTSGNTSNWSMKLSPVAGTTPATIENGYNNYSIVPDDYTKVATLSTVTDPGSSTAGSSVSTTYSAYISPTQPAGTYSGKVKYTLVHPSTAPKPEKPPTMQETTRIKAQLTNVGDNMQAIDSRDGKKYWITKLADGNIWMTQNLDLDLNSHTTFTPNDTDISSDWTPVNSTIAFTGTSVDGWQNSNYVPYSADPGELYVYSSGTINDDDQYTSLRACQTAHPDCSGHNHVGNYYNWSVAVANNDTSNITIAPNSICPTGWRLPVISAGANIASPREWGVLLVAEGIMTNPAGRDYAAGGFNNARKSPLWLTRSGSVYGGLLSGINSGGNYWSNKVYGTVNALNLQFWPSFVNPNGYSGREYGFSVRCVAR